MGMKKKKDFVAKKFQNGRPKKTARDEGQPLHLNFEI
jgi:hypothetical protein